MWRLYRRTWYGVSGFVWVSNYVLQELCEFDARMGSVDSTKKPIAKREGLK